MTTEDDKAFFGVDRTVDNTKLAENFEQPSFTITRAALHDARRRNGIKFENEYLDTYDRYDWTGRHYRRWLSMPGIEARWDQGEPGDENDGE